MKRIKLTEKEYNQAVNRAFLEGYEQGKRDGRREAIGEKVTPNMLREFLGLPKIEKEKGRCKANS
jgi:flagellar biosynthesis/type III secretory pathway protein FliH